MSPAKRLGVCLIVVMVSVLMRLLVLPKTIPMIESDARAKSLMKSVTVWNCPAFCVLMMFRVKKKKMSMSDVIQMKGSFGFDIPNRSPMYMAQIHARMAMSAGK